MIKFLFFIVESPNLGQFSSFLENLFSIVNSYSSDLITGFSMFHKFDMFSDPNHFVETAVFLVLEMSDAQIEGLVKRMSDVVSAKNLEYSNSENEHLEKILNYYKTAHVGFPSITDQLSNAEVYLKFIESDILWQKKTHIGDAKIE